VQGQVTAVQLMFTGCSSTCPPQGLLFALLSDAVSALPVRLLSLSIDTLGDTPERLRAWQQRFGEQARPAWQLALPRAGEIDTLTATLRGKAAQPGTHTSQVFVLDAQGRLAWRSGDLPPVSLVADLMRTLSRQT
jgi:protein SCO1